MITQINSKAKIMISTINNLLNFIIRIRSKKVTRIFIFRVKRKPIILKTETIMPVNLKDLIKTIIIKFRIIKNMIFSPTIKLIHIHMSHDKEKNP